jgi:cyclopropane-fatty-acyl-phospholipid synthase
MKGEGFYDQHSSPQLAAINSVLPWLEEAVGRMDLPDVKTIVVVDFGCSEGRNSIAAMRKVVDALRRRTPQPIQVVHSD